MKKQIAAGVTLALVSLLTGPAWAKGDTTKEVRKEASKSGQKRSSQSTHRVKGKKPSAPFGRKVHHLPGPSLKIVFSHTPYYLHAGLYYRLHNGVYTVVRPPVGLTIQVLPSGYRRVKHGPHLYFVFQGVYYIHLPETNEYQVVEAPNEEALEEVQGDDSPAPDNSDTAGSVYDALPEGAVSTVVDGITLFQLGDLYFVPLSRNGQVVYLAVRLDGPE